MDNLRFQFLSSDWSRIEKSEFSKEKFNFRSNCYFQYFKTIIYIYQSPDNYLSPIAITRI